VHGSSLTNVHVAPGESLLSRENIPLLLLLLFLFLTAVLMYIHGCFTHAVGQKVVRVMSH